MLMGFDVCRERIVCPSAAVLRTGEKKSHIGSDTVQRVYLLASCSRNGSMQYNENKDKKLRWRTHEIKVCWEYDTAVCVCVCERESEPLPLRQ
jgi:hypothetical protein